MKQNQDEQRLLAILEMISNIAALDFGRELTTSGKNDMIDAIAIGLNMLSEELNSQVVSKEKLNEINNKLEKFAFTTAHDLKSPLNSQSSIIYLLNNAVSNDNKEHIKLYVELVEKVNNDMKKLVQGILEHSIKAAEDIEVELIDFNLILENLLSTDNIKPLADVIIEDTLPVVKFNKSMAIQIIRNLLDNAIKYCDKERCKIKITCKETYNQYELEFKDNGPGIAKEKQVEIFELFKKSDSMSSEKSSGIGLSTVKNIVESYGGRIWVNSIPKEGASFIFTINK